MADQYGIDMRNVLETRDRIAINKLNRERISNEMEIQKAGQANMYNRIKSENPNLPEEDLKNMALNPELYEYDRERKDKEADRSASYRNSLSLQNHSLSNSKILADYKAGLKQESINNQAQRRLKIIKAQHPDMPDDVAEAYAGEQVKDFSKMLDTIQEMETTQQIDTVVKALNNDGAMLHTIASIEDPAQQAQAWTEYRNKKIKSVENPEVLKEVMNKLPEKFDPNWTALTIASTSDLMRDAKKAKEYLNQTEWQSKRKMGDQIGSPTYAQQTSKVNAISKKVDNIYKDTYGNKEEVQEIKAEVVKRWEEGGRRQNEDQIILEVINERKQKKQQNTTKNEDKGFFGGMFGSKKAPKAETKKASTNTKNNKILGKASKPEGTVGTYKGQNIKVVNGQWEIQ